MIRRGVSDKKPKAPTRRIDDKETKVGTMITTIEKVSMFGMETTIVTTTSIGVTMVTEMIGVGPMFLLKI